MNIKLMKFKSIFNRSLLQTLITHHPNQMSNHINWSTPLPKTKKTFTYLVHAPDLIQGSNRLTVRSIHLEGAQVGLSTGRIINAGAIFDSDPSNDSNIETKMIGSWLLCRAESLNEVQIMCKNDVYYQKGVWDPNQLTISPVANLV